MSLLAIVGTATMASPSRAGEPTLELMPDDLEARFALSALPPGLRAEASVYLLDPGQGYRRTRQGSSDIACLVQRTAWELADFRDDIYIPLCYDAAGSETYLKVIMDTAALRADGVGPDALKAEIEQRYAEGTYGVPQRAGVSYMVGPIFRTVGPPDMAVHTMAMPHLMFYAPFVSNEDIGAAPDLSDPNSLLNPFIDRQGNAEQSYMIQLVGAAEKAEILAEEKALIDDLCAYRKVLCLPEGAR